MDREKVMNGLQAIAENKACQNCCYPYMGHGVICGQEIARDAVVLLKEQEDDYKIILSDYEELAREHEKLLDKKIPLITNGQEVIRCKDCKHRPKKPDLETYESGFDLEFPDSRCPCECDDGFYSWYPDDNWFCGNGERKD